MEYSWSLHLQNLPSLEVSKQRRKKDLLWWLDGLEICEGPSFQEKHDQQFPPLSPHGPSPSVGTGALSQKQCCKLKVGLGGESPLREFPGRRTSAGLNGVQEAACWAP